MGELEYRKTEGKRNSYSNQILRQAQNDQTSLKLRFAHKETAWAEAHLPRSPWGLLSNDRKS